MDRLSLTILILALIKVTVLFGEQLHELDDFIEKNRKSWDVPGVAVVIVKDGEVVLKKGYGYLEVNNDKKVDENTIFQLASVTKAFTSTAMGVFVDQGKLSWDEIVINYLPEFTLNAPYPSRYATSRDLLAHRTGLPAFGGDLLGKLGYDDHAILRRIRFIEPTSSFRESAHYSNVGYFIAGKVLERVSNQTWEDTVKTTIIRPLNMKRTGFSEKLDLNNVAKGHVAEGNILKVVEWDRTGGFPAAGGMTSTASDMGLWMKMLLNGGSYQGKEILKAETVSELFRSSMVGEVSFSEVEPINEYSGFDFGLGWGNYHYNGKMIVEKGGGLDGIRTLVTLVPEMNLGIGILTNLNLTLFPEAIRARFLEIYLGESGKDLQPIIMAKNKELQKLLEPPKKPVVPHSPSHKLTDFTGPFVSPLYGKFTVKNEGDNLFIEAGPGQLKGTLTHLGWNSFILSWPAVNSGSDLVNFTFGPGGKVIEFQTEALGKFSAL